MADVERLTSGLPIIKRLVNVIKSDVVIEEHDLMHVLHGGHCVNSIICQS